MVEPTFKRVTIKLGTALLTGGGEKLNLDIMSNIASQVACLHAHKIDTAIVTSGAVAAGAEKVKIDRRTKKLPAKQILASVGQARLMQTYEEIFERYGITIAQVLLTRSDISERLGYLNARNTLLGLLELGIVPIINENDAVATEEIIGTVFGDNDRLSAMVANLIDADLLLILSDIAGLYTADPSQVPEAKLIPVVEKIDESIQAMARGTNKSTSIGGMITKLEAAKMATSCGITTIIADGRERDVIVRIVQEQEPIGTRFLPTSTRMESRQRWLVSELGVKGSLVVDDGAAHALKEDRRSLLPAGVKEAKGNFKRGDVVTIYNSQNEKLGYGITNYSAEEIAAIKGLHSDQILPTLGYEYGDEIIHRNNLVLLR